MSTIHLTKPQTRVWKSRARFKIISAGRRFGKSYLALPWMVNNSLSLGGLNYYIASSYVMGKQIAWRLLKELFGDHIKTKNESELFVEFENGSIVQIKGADNRDSLRGVSLSSVCLDEASFMVQEVWTEVIRPATSDKQAPVLFISSPSGWNWFKELYDYASLGEDINWQAWTFTTADGGNVKPEEIEAAKRELPIKTFNQEYLASFETLSNRVYSNFDRMQNVAESDPDLNDFPDLYIGIDFNVNPMSAIVGVKSADQLFLLDEIILPNSNTTELSAEIKRRYPKHKIRVYPDPSGRARKTSAAGGVTDFAILEQNGFSVIAPRAHPPVADRINEVQAMLQNAAGDRRLFVSRKCASMIKSLDGLVYKEKTGAPDKDSGLDHITDALGYLVHSEFPILKPISDVKIKFSW